MLLIIDNYDSFTHNLSQYFREIGQEVIVRANDDINIKEIENLAPDFIVISPGPKDPENAGISMSVISHFYKKIPILGVCLGHQCIGKVFGASITRAEKIMHGKTSKILHNRQGIFCDLPNNFDVMRYHSLIIDTKTLSTDFSIDAWAEDTIMAISHRKYPTFGIQFHPESILTEHGHMMLKNFINHKYQRRYSQLR